MAVNGIGASTPCYTMESKNKLSATAKGAIIAGGLGAASTALQLRNVSKLAKQEGQTLGEVIKTLGMTKGQYAGLTVLGIALTTLIGAGIGKLVQNHQEKKAEEQANNSINLDA